MMSYTVIAVLLCGALSISSAAPVDSLLSTSLDVLSDILSGKSLQQSTSVRGVTVPDSILIVTDALKAALQNSKDVKNGGDLQQAVAKSVDSLTHNFEEVFGGQSDRSAVEKTLKELIKKLEKIPVADIDGLLNKIAQFETEVINNVSQDANEMLNTVAKNAQKMIEEAQKEIAKLKQQHGGILDRLTSIAQKVLETTRQINEAIINKIKSLFNWGKRSN